MCLPASSFSPETDGQTRSASSPCPDPPTFPSETDFPLALPLLLVLHASSCFTPFLRRSRIFLCPGGAALPCRLFRPRPSASVCIGRQVNACPPSQTYVRHGSASAELMDVSGPPSRAFSFTSCLCGTDRRLGVKGHCCP